MEENHSATVAEAAPLESKGGATSLRSAYPPLMRKEDAARLADVSPRTILRMVEDGDLKAVKLRGQWRVNREALFDYLGLDGDEVVA